METGKTYRIDIGFEEITFPSFRDILVIAKNGVQGKRGFRKSLELLAPGCFEMTETGEGNVDAIFVNKRLLTKIPIEKILQVLRDKVFPYVAEGELIQVDFNVKIMFDHIIC